MDFKSCENMILHETWQIACDMINMLINQKVVCTVVKIMVIISDHGILKWMVGPEGGTYTTIHTVNDGCHILYVVSDASLDLCYTQWYITN